MLFLQIPDICLPTYPEQCVGQKDVGLIAGMFQDRTKVFHEELRWPAAQPDRWGWERDQFDTRHALYVVIACERTKRHLGSARLLPGRGNWLAEESNLGGPFGDGVLEFPRNMYFEVTRILASPDQSPRKRSMILLLLLAWGWEFLVQYPLKAFVGVYGTPMKRIYTSCGWPPTPIDSIPTPEGEITRGIWTPSPESREKLLVNLCKNIQMLTRGENV